MTTDQRNFAIKLIQALVGAALPDPAEGFPLPARQKFFEALTANLDVVYGPAEDAPPTGDSDA